MYVMCIAYGDHVDERGRKRKKGFGKNGSMDHHHQGNNHEAGGDGTSAGADFISIDGSSDAPNMANMSRAARRAAKKAGKQKKQQQRKVIIHQSTASVLASHAHIAYRMYFYLIIIGWSRRWR